MCVKEGDKVFLYGRKLDYTSAFFRAGKDRLLNPFDIRCENWDLWSEACTFADFERLAESLIPMIDEKIVSIKIARKVLALAAFIMRDSKERSVKKLLELLLLNIETVASIRSLITNNNYVYLQPIVDIKTFYQCVVPCQVSFT